MALKPLNGALADPRLDSASKCPGDSVKVKAPLVALVAMNGYVNEANVTPFTVTAGPFMLNAATSVPAVLTSLSPEILVGLPQVITEPSAQAHANGLSAIMPNAAAIPKQRSFLFIHPFALMISQSLENGFCRNPREKVKIKRSGSAAQFPDLRS